MRKPISQRITFGPHYYINLTIENNKQFIEIGTTHHGVKFEASEVDGEFEQIINQLREEYKANKTD
jgi:hypothetical protein